MTTTSTALPDWHFGTCSAPYKDGWHVVLEIEDNENVDDVPNTPDQVMNGLGLGEGFRNDNAYFWGVNKLNSVSYSTAQICGGYRANTDGCPRVKCYNLDNSWLGSFPSNINNAGFAKDMSKAIACAAGGGNCATFMTMNHGAWRFPIGHPDDPAPMTNYGEATTGNLKWSCLGYQQWYGWGTGWHFEGHGWSANFDNSKQELFMYDNWCGNVAHQPEPVKNNHMDYMNLFQIRVK